MAKRKETKGQTTNYKTYTKLHYDIYLDIHRLIAMTYY
jgi:hypothetical protein